MDLGPNASFIWTAYGMAAFVIAGLIIWLVLYGREQQRRLADFEARGVKRRAGPKAVTERSEN
ncbi:MAG: heme exporter protein CcmD [Hyphomicrobiaceae bacterium]|nr:heme exporter protein CcmD [Hyphomicrobiaceae bacterium]